MAELFIALYDYDATDEVELTIRENDIITIVSYGNGDGWWEGDLDGKVGLFPANYVEAYVNREEADDSEMSDFSEGEPNLEPEPVVQPEVEPRRLSQPVSARNATNNSANLAVVGRNLYRYSHYVKTGAEDFLLGNVAPDVTTDERLIITTGPNGLMWEPIAQPYTVRVEIGEQKTKFRAMKKFIDYNLTMSDTGKSICHRYKHFEWLYDQLTRKYKFISVPPLPSKSKFGTAEEVFLENRRKSLEVWLNRLLSHPVLVRCPVIELFLRFEGDEKEWKQGKRDTEQSPIVGATLFSTVETDGPVSQQIDAEVQKFKEFSAQHKASLHKVTSLCDQIQSNSQTTHAQFSRYSEGFLEMRKGDEASCVCCWRPYCANDQQLNKALLLTGQTYELIGGLIHEKTPDHISSIDDCAKEYLALLPGYDAILDTSADASAKNYAVANLVGQGKIEQSFATVTQERRDIIASISEAEINHIHDQRRPDFKNACQEFLAKEIAMYQEIVSKLQKAHAEFESA